MSVNSGDINGMSSTQVFGDTKMAMGGVQSSFAGKQTLLLYFSKESYYLAHDRDVVFDALRPGLVQGEDAKGQQAPREPV